MSGTIKAMQAIRFKTDEIHDSASKLELVKIVICSNCHEIPYRPIYTCQNGHIVCASCRGFNFRCGNCAAVVTDTRNRVAEEVVMSFVFRCKNFDEGCAKLIPSADVFKHLSNECEFRHVPCMESLKEKCKGKLIHYGSFLQHLKEIHGIRKVRPSNSPVKRIFHCDAVGQNASWPLYCFEYDGKTFFQHIMISNNIAYIWVSMFEVKDHDDYTATLILKKPSANAEVRHSFPVHRFRSSFPDVKRSGNYLTLLREQLLILAAENVRDENERVVYNYTWTSFITVSKNGNYTTA